MTNLRLTQVRIGGFKAASAVSMNVAPTMTLLIGMNGSGKSSILQALGFVRFLVEGRPQSFFDERFWDRQDVRFKSNPRSRGTIVSIQADFVSDLGSVHWEVSWGLNAGLLYDEALYVQRSSESERRQILTYSAAEGGRLGEIAIPSIKLMGSVLSAFPGNNFGDDADLVDAVVEWAVGIRSLELLAPQYMKGGTRRSPNDMGIKGDRLAGFLASLSQTQRIRVSQRLSRVYPLEALSTVRKRAGWIDLRVAERYANMGEIPVTHMSDGFMRLLALCAVPELGEQVSLVLLDEIEDGIEPHILGRVVDLLVSESRAQIIATSHSPLLVNHVRLDDIRFVTRSHEGRTEVTDASSMPAFLEGADYFGPGELWASTDLDVLQNEVAKVRGELKTRGHETSHPEAK